MFKFLISIAIVLGLAYFGLGFMGYELHPENYSYYIPKKSEGADVKGITPESYMNMVKFQQKYHPLIAKKKGQSAAGALDNSATTTMKQILQVDKFEQFDKLKKDIKVIQAKADERNKQVEDIMNSSSPAAPATKTT